MADTESSLREVQLLFYGLCGLMLATFTVALIAHAYYRRDYFADVMRAAAAALVQLYRAAGVEVLAFAWWLLVSLLPPHGDHRRGGGVMALIADALLLWLGLQFPIGWLLGRRLHDQQPTDDTTTGGNR